LATRKTSSVHARPGAPVRGPVAPQHAGLVAPRWAKVERIALIHREVRERLSPGAIDLLFAHGELVVEGGEAIALEAGNGRIYATVMMTIDLARCARRVREPIDTATAERLTELMREHEAVRARLTELARPHLARLARLPVDAIELSVDTSIRSEAMALLVDGDAVAWPRNSPSGPSSCP
jgi:hypothetical protein